MPHLAAWSSAKSRRHGPSRFRSQTWTRWLAPICLGVTLAGCLGPVALHQAVLKYDESVSRVEREMLLLNIARTHRNVPTHFTVTPSIAATFDYRANVGIAGEIHMESGASFLAPSLGVSTAENPTVTIVPVQGEEFTRRILTPMDENKFGFLVFQGAPIDMVLRLMADEVEVQDRQGRFQRFILNRPTRSGEYEEFHRLVLHLAWLNANRQLFVQRLVFEESTRANLAGPRSAADLMAAAEKGYRWRRVGGGSEYALTRTQSGRGAITNDDPRTLTDAERRALNALAAKSPENFILLDIRPDHPGGAFPLFGAFKLRSLNEIIDFLANGIARAPEFDVAPDPRTGSVGRNPRRTLSILESNEPRDKAILSVSYGGNYYALADTQWDYEAFRLFYQLFQMTVTDVSRMAVPSITISK